MKARALALSLLFLLPALLVGQYKSWYNFYNFSYGAKARAMGNAFTAVADDLTAAFWNPAGLAARRSPEFYLSYNTSSQKHDYDLQASETEEYNYHFADKLNQIDFFSVSAPMNILKRPSTLALSYYRYIPYGFKGSVQEGFTVLGDPSRARATTVTFTGSEGIDILAFSISSAVTDHFSLGATLQQFFGSGSMHLATVSATGEFYSQSTEKLQGRNVIIGTLFSPWPFMRLGFTWHSGLKNTLDSELLTWEVNKEGQKINKGESSCQARLVLPEQYSFGACLRLAKWLDVSTEYSRLDWEKSTIENYYGSGLLPFPQKDAWALGQKNARNLRFGLEAHLPFRKWQVHVRGGFSSDGQFYLDKTDQSVRIQCVAAGIGWEFTPNLLLDVSYQRQVAHWLEDGFFFADVPTHFRASVFHLSLTYRFGHIFQE
jgi:long-subunit fatty acid transport protein